MCRMLERYINDKTKAEMAARIDEIERIDAATGQPVGLVYSQSWQENRRAHFDFTTLKEAYKHYLNGGRTQQIKDAIDEAWADVAKAQRNLPAHVAQEYCRLERSLIAIP